MLQAAPRDSYVLATKLYFPMADTENRGLSRAQVHKQIDDSLRAPAHRLRRPLPVPPLRRRHAARGDDGGARPRSSRAGKARYIGFSEWTRGADPGVARAAPRARLGEVRLARSRSTRCSGATPSARSSRSARRTASRRSSGRRSPRACSPASTSPAQPPPGGLAGDERADGPADGRAGSRTTCSSASSGSSRSPSGSGSRWRSSRSPGCCARRTSPRRSSAPRVPSRCTTTPPPRASSSTRRRWRRSTAILG